MGAVTGKTWTDYSEPRIMAADLEAIEAGIMDAADATADLAASTIVGVGRPDIPATLTTPGTAALVAAATSGTVFRSTDGPQGAWEWMKQGAAWICTEGEFETLIATIPDTPGATLFAPGIRLTRHPQLVTVEINKITFTADYVGNSLTIEFPDGFQPRRPTYTPRGAFSTNPKSWYVANREMRTPVSGDSSDYRHLFSWIPIATWPISA